MLKLLAAIILLMTATSPAFAQQSIAQPTPATRKEEPDELKQILVSENRLFGQFHLVPIIVPQGEKVGDIFDTSSATLIADSADCFPGLKPRFANSQLPAVAIYSEKGLAAALGAGGFADADSSGTTEQKFTLDFADVQVERVSQVQLAHSLNSMKNRPRECEAVRPYIDASYTEMPPRKIASLRGASISGQAPGAIIASKPPPLLIGLVFSARRVVHVSTSQKINGVARISLGEELLTKLGIRSGFKVSAGGKNDTSNTIDLVGSDVIPVAFAPAFIVTQSSQVANGDARYTVGELDPDALSKRIQLARGLNVEKLTQLATLDSESFQRALDLKAAPASVPHSLFAGSGQPARESFAGQDTTTIGGTAPGRGGVITNGGGNLNLARGVGSTATQSTTTVGGTVFGRGRSVTNGGFNTNVAAGAFSSGDQEVVTLGGAAAHHGLNVINGSNPNKPLGFGSSASPQVFTGAQ